MSKYISNQANIFFELICNIKRNNKVSIIDGLSGCGKTFILEKIESEFKDRKVYWLKGDCYTSERDYYPFRNLIKEQYISQPKNLENKIKTMHCKEVIKNAGSLSPIGDDMISAIINNLLNKKNDKKTLYNYSLSPEELQVLFQLEYFCNNNEHAIFLCDDVQYWDKKSLQLLYMLLSEKCDDLFFLSNSFFAISMTKINDKNEFINSIYSLVETNVYTIKTIKKDNYIMALKQLGLKTELDIKLVNALFSITGGNLQLSRDIVTLLNDNHNSPEEKIKKIVEKKQLGHMLIERLNKFEKGYQINETLKYASLFGSTFQYFELEKILNKNEGTIRNILQDAEKCDLIRNNSLSASFIHELIRKAYKDEVIIEKEKYYLNYSKCIEILYPGNYQVIKESLYFAGEYKKALITGIMEYLQYLRRNAKEDLSNIFYDDLSNYYNEYLNDMTDAYYAFNEGEYKKCKDILENIEDIYEPILLAEKYYILSITLSKWLDNENRKMARECLIPFLNIENVDNQTELWERILSAYIVACIHDNCREEAKNYEKKLRESITQRLPYDFEASITLNILRRKSSMIHDVDKAFSYTRKSKDFFSENDDKILDPLQYYMAATNYMAAALKNGVTDELRKDIINVINLPTKYPYLNFQRKEIPFNNIIITSYLNKELNASIALRKLEDLLIDYQPENTSKTIIESNIAVLNCIEGHYEIGLSILERLYNEFDKISNLEFYYKYLITRNLCAVKYIFAKEEAISLLQGLYDSNELIYKKVFKLQTKSLLKNMIDNLSSDKLDEMWYCKSLEFPLNEDIPSYWNYYGRKYLFGELEFWSES